MDLRPGDSLGEHPRVSEGQAAGGGRGHVAAVAVFVQHLPEGKPDDALPLRAGQLLVGGVDAGVDDPQPDSLPGPALLEGQLGLQGVSALRGGEPEALVSLEPVLNLSSGREYLKGVYLQVGVDRPNSG